MLVELSKNLRKAIDRLRGAIFIDERTIKEVIRDIQRALLLADVDVELVLELSKRIERRLKKEEPPPGFTRRDLALKIVYEELVRILGGERRAELTIKGKKPYIILLVGIQGSGKTTTAAKLAYYLKKKGYNPALVCADNFRPGAYDQLKQLAEQINVPFFGEKNTSISAIDLAIKGVKHFSSDDNVDVIIIDTAGRHKNEKELLLEMKSIVKSVSPDEVILVIDGTMRKSAKSQAKAFHEVSPIGSIIVTKLDGSAKGGGALTAVVATGAQIKFIGTGEKIDEFEVFDPPAFVNRLLGFGDLKAVIERFKAYEVLSQRRMEALRKGKITLYDLMEQLESIRRMGPLRKLLDLLPSPMLGKLPADIDVASEEKIDKWIAALKSMTKEELLNPQIIDRSRIQRIARGAGVSTKDVRDLLKAYYGLKKIMRKIARDRKYRHLKL